MSRRVLLYTLIMVVLWGSHFSVASLTMEEGPEGLSPHALIFYKLLLATACLFVVIVLSGRLKAFRGYSAGDVARLAFAGVFGYYLYYLFLFEAAVQAKPLEASAEVSIMNYLFPMCTLLASAAILGEKLSRRAVVSALISLAGAYIVVCRGDLARAVPEHWRIDLIAFLAAVSWGVFSALGRKWKHEPITGLFIFMVTGLVISVVVLPFTAGRHYPVGWEIYGAFHVGFLCNTVGVMLWFAALRHAGASLVGNIALLTAFVNLLFIWLLLGQPVHPTAVLGLAVIVLGIALARTGRRAAAGRPVEPPA
ncbi:MAG TPA: DMT family transporter [Planctomycetota bacterium]|nr:DMT family transporter [Planctomycetota bacterium]